MSNSNSDLLLSPISDSGPASLRENCVGTSGQPNSDSSFEASKDVSTWKRWQSIIVLCFTVANLSSTYAIVSPSLFQFLQLLTGGQASTTLLGWVTAAYSFGRLVGSPIFGFWFDKRPTKEPLMFCFILSAIANISYAYFAAALSEGGQYVVLVARMTIGICASGRTVINSYIATSTTEKERAFGLGSSQAALNVGMLMGPVMALMFVPLGNDGVKIPAIRLHFNIYTGPAYLSTLLDVINIVLVIALFRDYRTDNKTVTSSKHDNEKQAKNGFDKIAAGTVVVLFFLCCGTFGVFETMTVPYSMDEFAWSRKEAVLYNGIISAFYAITYVSVLVIVGITSKCVELRVILMVGIFLLAISFFAFIPNSDQFPSLMSRSHHSPIPVGCRDNVLKWCTTVPQLLLPQYIAAIQITAMGYSSTTLPLHTLYSKILGPFPQGTMLGILMGAGSLSRGVAPIYITYLYDHFGPQITFAFVFVTLVVAIIVLLVTCYRMVPYGHRKTL